MAVRHIDEWADRQALLDAYGNTCKSGHDATKSIEGGVVPRPCGRPLDLIGVPGRVAGTAPPSRNSAECDKCAFKR